MSDTNEHTFICERCGKAFTKNIDEQDYIKDENRVKKKYHTRFCSRSCANSRQHTTKTKEKIRNSVREYRKNHISDSYKRVYEYTCEKCGKFFTTSKKFKQGRHIHCSDCKQIRKHSCTNVDTLEDISNRTISKIISRAHCGCALCEWDEARCDIHHIIARKNGGGWSDDNLIILCPNHHRMAHSRKISIDVLKQNAIKYKFPNWKDYYHISN